MRREVEKMRGSGHGVRHAIVPRVRATKSAAFFAGERQDCGLEMEMPFPSLFLILSMDSISRN